MRPDWVQIPLEGLLALLDGPEGSARMSLDTLPASAPSPEDVEAILRGRHGDPFRVLGMFAEGGAVVVNVFAPDAAEVTLLDAGGKPCAELDRVHPEGFFHARPRAGRNPSPTACAAARGATNGSARTPTASAPCWARWTNTSWPRAGTRSSTASSARIP
jgi:hypothetical protein